MVKLLALKARQILDSRGNPTVECDLKTGDGIFRASVPSGASTGKHEAHELRDNKQAFHGNSVTKAVNNINTSIAKKINGKSFSTQGKLDQALIDLDGTTNKHKLGANAILAVSMAFARAHAAYHQQELYAYLGDLHGTKQYTLPVPAFNIINGGKHAGNKLDIQEYMLLPVKANTFAEALRMGSETYHTLKKKLAHQYGKHAINVGDEGGFAPPFQCMEEPFDFIMDSAITNNYADNIRLGIDAAANSFWNGKHYLLEGKPHTAIQLQQEYERMTNAYPLATIEDPFHEEDFAAYAELLAALPTTQIVGDDLTVTNTARVQKAIDAKSCNCLLLKINQIGTITEALNAATLAKHAGWNIMVSHRSGETTDDFIADLAVGIASGQMKSGAPCRGERLAKYNRLLRIEEQLGRKATYAGKTIRFT